MASRRKNAPLKTVFFVITSVIAIGFTASKITATDRDITVAETPVHHQTEIITLALDQPAQAHPRESSLIQPSPKSEKGIVELDDSSHKKFTPVSYSSVSAPIAANTKLKSIKQELSKYATDELNSTPQIPTSGTKQKTNNSASSIEVVEIKRGDTLSSLFSARNLNTELHQIMKLGGKAKKLTSIHPGQELHFKSSNDEFIGIDLVTSINSRISIDKHKDTYQIKEITRDFDTIIQAASSTIDASLFLSGQRAGLSDALIMELANIFGWDIDFALDIRTGDQFSVVYEEKYLDGEKVKDGTIVAAEFVNQNRVYRAARYTDSTGKTDYYDANGRSMRKPFLRTPVDFARISSGFNLNRKHPILNKIRAHKGVDYAASTGTPIKAAGDGKIVHAGNKGGYGRTIIVQHGTKYSTLYAHMHKYAGNMRVGSRVKQGQIIGYVGKSGLATGPHLHYEFRVSGVHRNPLTVKLPDAQPLPSKEMDRFKAATADQFARLDLYAPKLVAQVKN
jgi:murein DD-endopeptidase MepM/ murein hydrolase activator NlpD